MIIDIIEPETFASNCYIVGDEKTGDGMVIDPGADAEGIMARVKQLKLKTSIIVVTHGHPDHVGALGDLKEKTAAPIVMNEADMLIMHSPRFSPLGGEAPAPDRRIGDGDTVKVGGLEFRVIQTPGHTPGGICLFGHGVCFSGDTLFHQGVGRWDFPGGSVKTLMKSINEKLMALPDDTVVFPGHGPKTTIGYERRWNPFLHEDMGQG